MVGDDRRPVKDASVSDEALNAYTKHAISAKPSATG
jgi:hypothetical protein